MPSELPRCIGKGDSWIQKQKWGPVWTDLLHYALRRSPLSTKLDMAESSRRDVWGFCGMSSWRAPCRSSRSSRRGHLACGSLSLSQAFPGCSSAQFAAPWMALPAACVGHPPAPSHRRIPPTAHIPGDLLPSGNQTHRQPGQGARFILQDSVFLLFLSSREAPRY